jgi:hypothetical protein
MNDIYSYIRKLAKQSKFQNLLYLAKDISGVQFFTNVSNFSKLQDIFLSYIYMYDSINQDLASKHISKHVYDNEIYEDAYMIWKREVGNKTDTESNKKKSDVALVISDKITFPNEVK